ncbi:MAG: hypothetical protein WC457_01730 [Patescibacteria group bacterium]
MWQSFSFGSLGAYEYEYDRYGYTGWYRCAGGRLADGRWPEWNFKTGATRYR